MQLAKQAAQASLESRVLSLLEAEHRRRRVALIRSRSDTAAFPTEADYSAALDALNATYTQLQANVQQHRHSPACEAALSPINLPALGSIPEETAWDASLSSGTDSSLCIFSHAVAMVYIQRLPSRYPPRALSAPFTHVLVLLTVVAYSWAGVSKYRPR